MKHLWAPWRMTYLNSSDDEQEACFLCSAVAGEGAAAELVVERAELTITLLNRFPYNSGHLMVVPHRHQPDLLGLSESEGAALISGAQRATRAITIAFAAEGYNVGINQGSAAGASVEHVHLHVVPRWHGDTNFMPVLADTKVLPEHLEATAEKLRSAYATL